MGGAGDSSGDEKKDAWEAVSLVLRIVAAGMSLASAIMTFASTQCVYRDDGSPTGAVSYSNYGSLQYSALGELLSAVLQGVAIWLEVLGKEEWSKTVELIDKLVLALTSTSGPLLFAVDDITSCGPPRGGGRSNNNGARRQPKNFDGKLQLAAYAGLGSLVPLVSNEVVKGVKRHKHVDSTVTPAPAPEDPCSSCRF